MFQRFILATALACTLSAATLVTRAQDVERQTIAVTYPLEQTVKLNFRGTSRLPRLTGDATVRRSSKRNTRVQLDIKKLPRPQELGSIYTTYILWAITPEGRADNLGEIKRSSLGILADSKVDVTTPLQTFSLIVTAEPHFLVPSPSKMVILENLPPSTAGVSVQSTPIRYIGNSSDYYEDPRIPELAEADLSRTPTSLLGARQAILLAKFARSEEFADAEFAEANKQLEAAENAFRLGYKSEEVDTLARRATSLAARSEEVAISRHEADDRRKQILDRDRQIKIAEQAADESGQRLEQLQGQLNEEARAHDLTKRDLLNVNQQLTDTRTELARLRDELQEAKSTIARMEAERAAAASAMTVRPTPDPVVNDDEARQAAEQQRQADQFFRQTLSRFGTVRESPSGLVLTLAESLWVNNRSAMLSPSNLNTVETLAAALANNPNYRVIIESHTDSRGVAATLRQMTQSRADLLAGQFEAAGVTRDRLSTAGYGGDRPLGPSTTAAGRKRNQRIDITLSPVSPVRQD